MTKYNTNNPVGPNGSSDPRDLYDNSQVIDLLINSINQRTTGRLGNELLTWAGLVANTSLLGKPYATLELAQEDINSGVIANNASFIVVSTSNSQAVDIYKNASGQAQYLGKSVIDGNYVAMLATLMNFVLTVIPKDLSNSIPGWAFPFVNAEKTGLFGGFKTDGGWHLAGMPDAVQDRLKVIADASTTARIPGFHLILMDVLRKSGFAISDDWGLWLAGLEKPVQDEINALKSGVASSILRPYNGALAVFDSATSITPVYFASPVVNVQKLSTGGASMTYLSGDSLAGGTINLIVATVFAVAPNNWEQRPIPSYVITVEWRAGRGQSLIVGGGDRVTNVDQNLLGHALVFTGAGGDRGASGTGTAEGPVTDEALNVFKDAESIGIFRENCIVPGAQRYLNDAMNRYGVDKKNLPSTVSRIDGKSGMAYAGLKKGTQVFIDGETSFASFIDRVLAQGKIPVAAVNIYNHGQQDSLTVTTLGQYEGYLEEWINDTNSSQLNALSAKGVVQAAAPLSIIDQMGSIKKTSTNRGDLVAFDQIAICKRRADTVCSGPTYILNRKYPLSTAVDEVHLSGLGYAIMGEYHGQVQAFHKYSNPHKKWTAVYPVSFIKSGLNYDVTFSSPFGLPLKINNKYGVAPNLGFDLENGSANIVSAVQISDFVFRFTLDAAPAAGEYLRCGLNSTDSHYCLVNISDTATDVSVSDPTFVMEHFCCVEHLLIS
jgi:hypothetical protein